MGYWPLICVMIASITAMLGFGAGAAVGASLNASEFKDVFIPMFSALGGWVSGAGALAAVGTTIYLYRKQESENDEDLEVKVYRHHGMLHIDVLCLSRHPAFVTDIYVEVGESYYWLSNSDPKQLDVHVSYKEKKTFNLYGWCEDLRRNAGINLMDHADKLAVETTFSDYTPDYDFVTNR